MNNNSQLTFIKEDPWRIFRIMAEFVDSFETLSQVGPGVTIFGSARMSPRDRYYKAAVELGKGLAKHNLAIITGGGPGIMEAANKGAALAKGRSVGLNIELPHEQAGNRFANVPIHFHYFFSRKVKWMKSSLQDNARYISPGDLDLVTLTDDPQEAIDIILEYERRVGPPDIMPKAFA
jgi:predicted Rossmann-fold nucleotide-binding protein